MVINSMNSVSNRIQLKRKVSPFIPNRTYCASFLNLKQKLPTQRIIAPVSKDCTRIKGISSVMIMTRSKLPSGT